MIVVKFSKDEMHVSGHAEKGPTMRNITCATASSIILCLTWIMGKGYLDEGKGMVPLDKRFKRELVFAVYMLRCLARTSPGNLRLVRVPDWLKHKKAW